MTGHCLVPRCCKRWRCATVADEYGMATMLQIHGSRPIFIFSPEFVGELWQQAPGQHAAIPPSLQHVLHLTPCHSVLPVCPTRSILWMHWQATPRTESPPATAAPSVPTHLLQYPPLAHAASTHSAAALSTLMRHHPPRPVPPPPIALSAMCFIQGAYHCMRLPVCRHPPAMRRQWLLPPQRRPRHPTRPQHSHSQTTLADALDHIKVHHQRVEPFQAVLCNGCMHTWGRPLDADDRKSTRTSR